MEFSETLRQLEAVFQDYPPWDIPENEWAELASGFAHVLDAHVNELVRMAQKVFGRQCVNHSGKELVVFKNAHPQVCGVEIKPTKPRNTLAGLVLSASLYRSTDRSPADVTLKLSVYGARALAGFRGLYANYRRPLSVLVEGSHLEFQTGAVLKRLEGYRGKNVPKKLDLYFSEDLSEDDSFDLEGEFYENDRMETVVSNFLVLTALYDSTYGYISPPRNFDRILKHYLTLSAFRRREGLR
jgi:hypothetical protein